MRFGFSIPKKESNFHHLMRFYSVHSHFSRMAATMQCKDICCGSFTQFILHFALATKQKTQTQNGKKKLKPFYNYACRPDNVENRSHTES